MVAVLKQPLTDEWHGLYRESWKGIIHDEAFAHPAKYSRALISYIYKHVIDEGWTSAGDSVVDPFGGVALGGLDAMLVGLNWSGCELEEKFVGLGRKNIELWNRRYSRLPNWGTARLLQGDSRKLSEVLSEAGCCVSSPPYSESLKPETEDQTARKQERFARSKSLYDGRRMEVPSAGKAALGGGYGVTEGQLGAMREGSFDCAVSSPPYASDQFGGGGNKHDKVIDAMKQGYGTSDGQLGSMREGSVDGQAGNHRGATFWSASRTIIEQLHTIIRPGGHAVFVVKSFVRNKQIVDFPAQWAELCEAVGFRLLHDHHALLIEHSGTQRGFDGDKELRVERKSFFRRLSEAKGSPRIDHENVLCMVRL